MSSTAATFSLTFDFKTDASITLPIDAVVEIYFEFLGTTTIKDHYIRGMLPLWLYGYEKGDPRLQEAAFGPLLTPGLSFVWPWYLEWREHFREQHLLPRAWEPFADEFKDRRSKVGNEVVPLLCQTLWQKIWNRRCAKQHAESPGYGPKKTPYSYRLEADCEASCSLHKDRLVRLVPGDTRTYPPFYPGDRTRVARDRQKGFPA